MELYFLFFLLLILGIIASYTDIRYRKVSNFITLPLLVFSLVFSFFFGNLILLLVFVPLLFFSSYFVYKKGFFGGGDGKLLFAISVLMLSVGGVPLLFGYFLILALIYSIFISGFVFYKVPFSDFIPALKSLGYKKFLFQISFLLVIVFSFLAKIETGRVSFEFLIIVWFLKALLIYMFYLVCNHKFWELNDDLQTLVIGFFLIILLVFYLPYSFYFFIFVFFVRVYAEFISLLASKLESLEGYNSPFALFLFLSAMVSFIFVLIGIFPFLFSLNIS